LGVHLALLGFAHDPTALGSPVTGDWVLPWRMARAVPN